MESGQVNIVNLNKAIERQITEKVKLMANNELLDELQNAIQEYRLLIQQDEERGKKTNDLRSRPSEQKLRKKELVITIEAIQKEQVERKKLQK